MFGLAIDTNLEDVRKEINDQRLMSETALADGTRTRQAVAEFRQITNHRLNNMHAVHACCLITGTTNQHSRDFPSHKDYE
jgi:uncharacterized protein YdaU (DUF1376 family)